MLNGTAMSVNSPKSYGAQIFHTSRSHLKILGARRVTWWKLHADNTKIFWAQNRIRRYVELVTWICGTARRDRPVSNSAQKKSVMNYI